MMDGKNIYIPVHPWNDYHVGERISHLLKLKLRLRVYVPIEFGTYPPSGIIAQE